MKKSTAVGFVFWGIFTALFIAIAVGYVPDAFMALIGRAPQVTELIKESEDGHIPTGYASLQIDACLGNYATKTETSYLLTTRTEHYIVWLPDDSFMTVLVQSNKIADKLDEITDKTWDYVNGEANTLPDDYVEVTGEVKLLERDAQRLFEDTIYDYGIDTDENVIRYEAIKCTKTPKFDELADILFAVFLIIVSIIWFKSLLKSARKYKQDKMAGIEPSADKAEEAGKTSLADAGKPVVSAKDAFARIKNENFKKTLKINSLSMWGNALLAIVTAAIMGFVFYRTNIYVAPDSAVLNLADPQDVAGAKKYATAELTIDSVPDLGDYLSGSKYNYYIVTSGENFYVASIAEEDIDRIRKEVKETGSSRLFGYFDKIPSDPQWECLKAMNNYYGTNYGSDDYESVFGKYIIEVDPDYNGAGIGGDIIIIVYIFCILFFLLGIVMFFACKGERKLARKKLMAMTDAQYAAFEESIEGFEAGGPGCLEKLFKPQQ